MNVTLSTTICHFRGEDGTIERNKVNFLLQLFLGSGKSSLLAALAGEMRLLGGSANYSEYLRAFAFVSQVSVI